LSSPISGTESTSRKVPQEKLYTIHLEAIHHATEAKDKEKALEIEKTIAQDSQYEPVRAAVRNTEGGEIANKVPWILGLLLRLQNWPQYVSEHVVESDLVSISKDYGIC
jgi:hypothetical protein